ncbi:MAG: transketolase [Acidobacteria bacterium]|nr:MAG: transketolase [Acidobacteriota bacterium]REJ99371.1 MAG: transketolase [Acidobacteriota bacterium]REK15663.1 MAG: transketolase [Acidobacteriota bacterium]REK44140.1 MAG: transketolase [Acidobacteriota bacterium]
MTQQSIEQLSINTIRTLSLDAVQEANSGHPGLPLGAAPMAYVLWTKFLRHNPENPKWFNRDRFILSAGHGSMLIYSLLHLTGYESVSLQDIKDFRQWGSRTPGHPENHLTAGVEVTTGPLGQGFANGVGMAVAEAYLSETFNREGYPVVDNNIYAICSDGDLMEGVSYEAASLAGHLGLGKLVYLYDDNHVTIEGQTDLAFSEDVTKRFESCGWHVSMVEDGNDLDAIETAISEAKAITSKPSLIRVKTVIGFGMPHEGTSSAHSDAPGVDAVKETKRNLGWNEEASFYVPDEVYEHFSAAKVKGAELEAEWNSLVDRYEETHGETAGSFRTAIANKLPEAWEQSLPSFDDVGPAASRVYSGEVLNAIAPVITNMIGGSADLGPSNKTDIKSSTSFADGNFGGRIIHFGVREHAMGSLLNGIALYGGMIPFGGTFLTFSDYMRPAIRLAALSEIQTIYVFTHDSIGLGEDGPTHQSVEHVAALRAIPNLNVIRPCDAHEVREAWKSALERKGAPTALALSRQKVAVIDRTEMAGAEGLHKGAYILAEADGGRPSLIIIATGSEVGLALETREKLQEEGTPVRVVSMPCWEIFEEQSAEYKRSVLPSEITARLVIEAGVSLGWDKYIGPAGASLTVDRFGASAPAEVVFDKYGFNIDNAVAKAKSLL